jgi:hypothetical protein
MNQNRLQLVSYGGQCTPGATWTWHYIQYDNNVPVANFKLRDRANHGPHTIFKPFTNDDLKAAAKAVGMDLQ